MSRSAEILRDFLEHPDQAEGTLGLTELRGFLFAVANGPEIIMPSEWIPVVFGEEMVFDSDADAEAISLALINEYNEINEFSLKLEQSLPPGCELRHPPMANLEDDAPIGRWARGFMEGNDWLNETWDAYLPEDDADATPEVAEMSKDLGAALMVLGFFASRGVAQAFFEETKAPTLEGLVTTMHDVFPDAIREYVGLGRSVQQAVAEAAHTPHRRARPKVGRNELCSCGSGRKFKKCCGVTH